MNILNALTKLRDDLKEWSTNNMIALKSLVPTKTSELTNDSNFITKAEARNYTDEKITALVDSAPDAMNTLNELAEAINNHEDIYEAYVNEMSTALAKKADKNHGTHLTLGTGAGNAYYGDKGKVAYDHSQVAHAPANAQKNSDITKAEIEAKLTGEIDTHTHAGESIYHLPANVFTTAIGSSTSGKYLSTKWTVANINGITQPYDGMTLSITLPTAGLSGAGVVLSIDGGTTYHPIVRNLNTVLSTYYSVGTIIIVTYNANNTAAAYLTSGTKTTPEGIWQIADYDTDTKTRSSNKVNTKMFIIGASEQSTSGQTTYSNKNCYIGKDNCLYSNGLKVVDSKELAFRDRTHTSLYPTGTSIPANADLNTIDYIKVGCYYCSKNADAKTLINCPVQFAFMMEVLSPLSPTFDDETSENYVYRLRRITNYRTGKQYIQYIGSGATAGVFTYNEWKEVAFTDDIPDAEVITKDIIDNAFTEAGL